jgi:hypothetical protein
VVGRQGEGQSPSSTACAQARVKGFYVARTIRAIALEEKFMANRKEQDENLDQTGRAILRAAAADERQTEAAVASPFLYAKIRARIAEEDQKENRTLSILYIFKRAIPVLAFITIMMTLAFWFTPKNMTTSVPLSNNILPNPDDPEFHIVSNPTNAPLTACSIASKEECAVSTKDVVAILMHNSEGKK